MYIYLYIKSFSKNFSKLLYICYKIIKLIKLKSEIDTSNFDKFEENESWF